jgi:hypothetical protein
MTWTPVTVPSVGDAITAAQGATIADDLNGGPNMGTPTSTTSNGTSTSGTTETRDVVLGSYTFTAVANRRYRAVVDGLQISGGINDVVGVRIRNGGNSIPVAGSTQVAQSQTMLNATGGPGQSSVPLAGTFVPGAGTVTLGVFTIRLAGAANETPVGNPRELYAVDFGPA